MSDEVKRAIRKMVKPGGVNSIIDRGIVISVDKNAVTCVVQLVSNEAVLEDVALKPIISDGDTSQLGIILFPAVQSFVTVGQIDDDNTDMVVIGVTVIESIALDTATALKLLITAEGKLNLNAVQMVFNNGNNGGIPLLKPLTAAINKLQQQVNSLGSAFKSHIHPVAGDATGPTATPSPAPITPLIKTTDIENKIITQ